MYNILNPFKIIYNNIEIIKIKYMAKSRKSIFKLYGFRNRKKTAHGRKILKNRRKKGRQNLITCKK